MRHRELFGIGFLSLVLVCSIVYFTRSDRTPTQYLCDQTKPQVLTALPRLDVQMFKSCDAYNELRNVNFAHSSLQSRLCANGPAYVLREGRFPLCQLANLPQLFFDEVNKTMRFVPVQRAVRKDSMMVYTFSDQDLISRQIIQSKNWETGAIRQMLEILKMFGPESVTFMDIGSNLGLYSLQAREEGFPVVALDANIRTLIRLQLSARKLGILDERLKLFWCFLDEEVALKHMHWVALTHDCHIGGASSGSTNWLYANPTMDTIPVMTARTDDLVAHVRTKKVVIKMDIESGEHMFMKTGARLFKELDVIVLQMEFWRWNGLKPQDSPYFKFITNFMTSRNFSLISVGSRKVMNVATFGEWDGMWVRNDYLKQLAKP